MTKCITKCRVDNHQKDGTVKKNKLGFSTRTVIMDTGMYHYFINVSYEEVSCINSLYFNNGDVTTLESSPANITEWNSQSLYLVLIF